MDVSLFNYFVIGGNLLLIIPEGYIFSGFAFKFMFNYCQCLHYGWSLLLKVYKASNFYAYITLSTVLGWGLFTSGCSLLCYTWWLKMPETKVSLFFLFSCHDGKSPGLRSGSLGPCTPGPTSQVLICSE